MVETLCDVHGILSQTGCSYSLSTGILAKIGKKAADLHLAKYGRRPDKQPAKVYSKTYNVYHYPDEDRWMVYRSAAIVLTADFVKGGSHHPHILRSRLRKLQVACQRWPKAAAVITRLLEAVDKKYEEARSRGVVLGEQARDECVKNHGAYTITKGELEKACAAINLDFFTKKAMELFTTISGTCSAREGVGDCRCSCSLGPHISANDTVFATWLTTGFHPKTVLFEALKRQTELWLRLLRTRTVDPGELFSESQKDMLTDAFMEWKNGRQFKPLDRKLRNAGVFEEFRRRMKPSLN